MGRDALDDEIIRKSEANGDFVTGDDGFVVFWPEGQCGGFEAWHLRVIADELDRRNASWQAEISSFFDAKNT